jgi:hypothetical protein
MADHTTWRHHAYGRYPRRSAAHLLLLNLTTWTVAARLRRLQRGSGHAASVKITAWEHSTTAEQIIGATGRCTQAYGRTLRAALRDLQRAVTHKDQNDIADHGPVALPKRGQHNRAQPGVALTLLGFACLFALLYVALVVMP